MRDTKTASFLIVNYKSVEDITRLVSEIRNNFSFPYEVLVFDNSNDFECSLKNIKVYKTDKNVGFGNAVDFISTKATYDYLFILNPDIHIIHNLDEVLKKFIKLPIEYAVFSLNKAEKIYKTPFLGRIIDTNLRFSSNSFVIYKEYFKIVGGFNPNYFMYFEDNDFALKLGKFGLKTYFPSQNYVIHNKNYSFKQGLKRKKWYYQSFLYYLKHNFKLRYFIFYIPLKLMLYVSKIFK